MADEEAKAGGALAAFSKNLPAMDPKMAANALVQGADDASEGGGDRTFLSYSGKKSAWTIGRDKKVPDEDAVYIIDPRTATTGFKCWKDSSPVATHQWGLLDPNAKTVDASELADHGPYKAGSNDGWQAMLGVSMFDIDNAGDHIEFSTTSISGRNALGDLIREGGQMWTDEGGEFPPLAVVQLRDEQFKAQGQWNGKPVFEILGWASVAEAEAFLEDEDSDLDALLAGEYEAEEAAPEPKPKRTRKPKAEVEEVTEDEAPKRTRTRKPKAEVEEAEVVEEEPAPEPTTRRRRRRAA